MTDYEKLGAFYLGRPYDLGASQATEGLLLYDSKDLVTHGVCFGMTGSGKTGLCAVLLEEAAIDGIPAIVIDPKGDLCNLLLTFPDLSPADFEPWIQESTARQKSLTPPEFAAQQSDLWKKGLAAWGQDGGRIKRLRAAADFAIYTPGSEAGLQVSLLKSFDAPSSEARGDRELMRERVMATVSSLLGLLGIDADPLQSREHILLSTIFDTAWSEGRNLDLPTLIPLVQNPPFTRVGMFDLDSFYPAKDRFGLAMMLNNLLASPTFEAWREGEPLDVSRMLYTANGRPRISIFSIAHLGDAERMFFVSTLLNQVVSWMRSQPGTTSLRALVYMDEIAGYLPPVANPPSKAPLMLLLKQARAFGVGVVLATQNPADLDYKALGNAGTWFIGRLQTERDQMRVLDGLAGAAAGKGEAFDRQAMEQTLAGLGKRVFLMYNVHDDAPEIFETRWAMSYLCGPLTRTQIATLMEARKASSATAPATAPAAPAPGATASTRPALPPGIDEYFLPVRSAPPRDAQLHYAAGAFAAATIRFTDSKTQVDEQNQIAATTPISGGPIPVDWQSGAPLDLDLRDLESSPRESASFSAPPGAPFDAKDLPKWGKDFADWLYGSQRLTLRSSPSLKVTAKPQESERDFRIRLEMLAREERDRQVDELRKKYASKLSRVQDKVRRAEDAVEREQEQAKQQKLQSTISVGASLIGALFGRRVLSASTVSRAGTAMRSVGRATKEARDVDRAQANVEASRQELAELEQELAAEIEKISERIDAASEQLDEVEIRPRKSDVQVKLVALLWAPYWRDSLGNESPAWH